MPCYIVQASAPLVRPGYPALAEGKRIEDDSVVAEMTRSWVVPDAASEADAVARCRAAVGDQTRLVFDTWSAYEVKAGSCHFLRDNLDEVF